jgi:hypothetical protein
VVRGCAEDLKSSVQFILVGDRGGGSLTVVAWVFKRPDRAGGTVDSRLAASEQAESNNFPGFSIRGLLVSRTRANDVRDEAKIWSRVGVV